MLFLLPFIPKLANKAAEKTIELKERNLAVNKESAENNIRTVESSESNIIIWVAIFGALLIVGILIYKFKQKKK